ncbi:hypothetical protein [Sulfobacillus harzensis]|uniref:Uncharacterized protein n=1 Tax=Sulfobacillus harzensis TaxID=2729629 RepID=A0A7Y0Q2F9_9FIRM|nr:hypothetical protein [Sulfobacillus harzensis]NMP21871.1 hypothetical protein [Sulfobacillus harzensis]
MTRYDGTLCLCPDCTFDPPLCVVCETEAITTEWEADSVCAECRATLASDAEEARVAHD